MDILTAQQIILRSLDLAIQKGVYDLPSTAELIKALETLNAWIEKDKNEKIK